MKKATLNRIESKVFSLFTIVFCISLTLAFSTAGYSQQVRNQNFKADQALKSNARVNPSTLAMELSIPIGGYQGRGGASLPIQFNYSSKVWQIKATTTWESQYGTKTDTKPMFAKRTAAGWTSNLGVPRIDYQFQMYKPFIDGISTYDGEIFTQIASIDPNPNPPNYPIYYVKRMFLVMPDGSSHEFRKDDGVYNYGTSTSPGGPGLPDQTGTFLSVDGSRLRLEITENSKTLFMPDGSRYLFGSNDYATSFIDSDGNKMTYDFANRRWTDTMGRIVDDPMPRNWNDFEQTQVVEDKVAHFPSKDGGTFDVTFSWRYLKDPQGGESGLEDTSQTLNNYSNVGCQGNVNRPIPAPYLFTNPEPSIVRVCNPIGWEGMNWWVGAPFNPIVLTKITLPNGQSYQFKYNVYGEIIKIIYPTGAYERFLYGAIEPVQPQGSSYDQANRGVTDRWVSTKGDGTDEIHWSYQVVHGYQQPYKVVTTNPDSTKTEQYLYTEDADAPQPYGFGDAKTGRSYEDRVISSTNQLLRRHLTSYEVTGTTGGYPGATRDLRPNKEVTIIFEPGSSYALAQMTETVYDSNADPQYFAQLNPKQVKTYNYIVLDLTTAQTANIDTIANLFTSSNLAKIEETDYLYDANYKARNINGLPIETRIKDASGTVKAKSQIFYDEATYPVIDYGSTTNWENPNTSYRGNATTTRSWTDVSNNQYVETHAQYDNFGNLRKAWDGRGNLTETEYSAVYYYAYPTKITTPIPDPTGQNGSATAFQTITSYDFNTGLTLSITDANSQTTQTEYNDPLLRPTRTVEPNGQQIITEYGSGTSDATRFIKVKTQIDADVWKENYTWFDGLSRKIKTQEIDSDGDVFTETQYDPMGRVKKVSNPYRTGETVYWTENFYDDLGRVIKVKTADNAEVNTAYSLATSGSQIGTVETVTDEAGKQRRTIEDAQDNLIRVDEPNDSNELGSINSPNQPTIYSYDTLENLTHILQGAQTRIFVYDSLSRLKSATNPESGTFQYTYDANGNLLTKTDARSVMTTYAYDALNRVISRNYSDATPDISYFYDNPQAANSKEKLTKVSSSVSETRYTAFDAEGRVLQSQQITDGQTYSFSYTYNLDGDLLTQTYPSGKVVKFDYDNNGDLAQVSNFQNQKVYANSFSYTAHGQVEKMRLGNGKWETTAFNSRLQITQIGLGHSATDTSLWKVNYEYGDWENGSINPQKNNGNLARQTITVPTIGQATGFTAVQAYGYDSLDRLKSATETIGGNQTWKQTFLYDRFGNRNFDTANTTLLSVESNVPKVANPEVLPSNNRFKQDQDNDGQADYLYDGSGNLTKDAQNRTFTYDAENRQLTAAGSNLSVSYFYDGNGKRVKSHNAVTNQTTIFVYDANGDLAAEYTVNVPAPQNPTISYLTEDALGSVRAITNSFGEIKARRDFLPFGEEIYAGIGNRTTNQNYSANADDTRKKFATYQRDSETGLDFAQSRYYSPVWGRFTSPDEFKGGPDELFDFEDEASTNPTFYADLENPQSLNKYQYAYNNPVKYIDSDGHCPVCFIIAAVAVAIITGPDYAVAPTGRETAEEMRSYRSTGGNAALVNLIPMPGLRFIPKAGRNLAGRTVINQTRNQVVKQTTRRSIINGYTKHGLNQAIGRNGGRGVKAKTILETTRNPSKVRLQKRNDKQSVKFLRGSGKNKSSVLIGENGKIITVTGKARGRQIWKEGTNRPQGSGSAQRKANKRGFSYNPNLIR